MRSIEFIASNNGFRKDRLEELIEEMDIPYKLTKNFGIEEKFVDEENEAILVEKIKEIKIEDQRYKEEREQRILEEEIRKKKKQKEREIKRKQNELGNPFYKFVDSDLLVTSGYSFDGYVIKEYLGICSGETALGTSYLSSFGASLADLLGTDSTLYSGKLEKAKLIAMEKQKQQAIAMGANAIIGFDLDYEVFTADIIGVIANGTAVYIEPMIEKNSKVVTIKDCDDEEIKLFKLQLNKNGDCRIALYNDKQNISALNVDIVIHDVFGDITEVKDVYFADFEENYLYMISGNSRINLTDKTFVTAKYATVKIKKYIINDQIKCK